MDEIDIIKALEEVIDPELNLNIVEIGLIYSVKIQENSIEIELTLTSPMCPVGPEILQNAKDSVLKIAGDKEVNIELVWTPPWNPEKMTEEAKLKVGLL